MIKLITQPLATVYPWILAHGACIITLKPASWLNRVFNLCKPAGLISYAIDANAVGWGRPDPSSELLTVIKVAKCTVKHSREEPVTYASSSGKKECRVVFLRAH